MSDEYERYRKMITPTPKQWKFILSKRERDLRSRLKSSLVSLWQTTCVVRGEIPREDFYERVLELVEEAFQEWEEWESARSD